MAGTRRKLNTFRSEVDTLRKVIRRTVDDVIGERLGDIEKTEAKLKAIKRSLRKIKAPAKRMAPPGLKPLRERVEELRRDTRALEKRVRSSVDRRVKKDMLELLKSRRVENAIEDITESKLSSLHNKILMFKREMEMLRGELESSKTKRLEEELEKKVMSLKSAIAGVAMESRTQNMAFGSEIEKMKGNLEMVRELDKQLRGLNLKDIARDLEIIKTKQEWIENNIERIDIKPILEKMEQLEHRIRVIGINSPVVLE